MFLSKWGVALFSFPQYPLEGPITHRGSKHPRFRASKSIAGVDFGDPEALMSFLVLTSFLLRDSNILPKKELHLSVWGKTPQTLGTWSLWDRFKKSYL